MMGLIEIMNECVDPRTDPNGLMSLKSPMAKNAIRRGFETEKRYKRLKRTSKVYKEQFDAYMAQIEIAYQELSRGSQKEVNTTHSFYRHYNKRLNEWFDHPYGKIMTPELEELHKDTIRILQETTLDSFGINNGINQLIDEMVQKGVAYICRFPVRERVRQLRTYEQQAAACYQAP